MKIDLIKAKELLKSNGYTCVFCKGDTVRYSFERGVKPLINLLDKGDLSGFSAADKVVGKAAAFLYILLGVDCIYADVISRQALKVLENNDITVFYDNKVEAIINRAGTGFCPMETAVENLSDPREALAEIKSTLEFLNRK